MAGYHWSWGLIECQAGRHRRAESHLLSTALPDKQLMNQNHDDDSGVPQSPLTAKMSGPTNPISSLFRRSKKLDIDCFINVWTLRDHTKRKAFEATEAER
jgi:hypothetical protein